MAKVSTRDRIPHRISLSDALDFQAPQKGNQDNILVFNCLTGSEEAWDQFYSRYVGLVRNIVRRKLRYLTNDVDDITQTVFTNLVAALPNYDRNYSLLRFISTIAERASIQEFRSLTAAKREAYWEPLDLHDGGIDAGKTVKSNEPSPEEQLLRKQHVALLRAAINSLDYKCRRVLRLRYHKELPYKDISNILNVPANTLAVQTKRCVHELVVAYRRLLRKGVKP